MNLIPIGISRGNKMGNYKNPMHTILGFPDGGILHQIGSGKTPVLLYDRVANATDADGFLDHKTGTIKQITTGKTFTACGLAVYLDTTTATDITINTGDTENAETALVFQCQIEGVVGWHYIPVNFTIASAKFITYNLTGASAEIIELVGYED